VASDEITVMAYFRAKEGRAEDLRDELLALIAPATSEPGVLRFELYSSIEDPNLLAALDTFANQDALDSHVASAPVSRFFNEVLPDLAGAPDVVRMRLFGKK
jgi:quinol monooxygenase YgiN